MNMTMKLILSCFLMMMMAACSKCGGGSAKGEYITKLDSRCNEIKKEFEELTKKSAEAQAKDDLEAVAQLMRDAITRRQALVAELKAISPPEDDAASLQAFWAETDISDAVAAKLTDAIKHMAEVNKQAAAEQMGGNEESAPAVDAEKVKAAEAAVMQANQEMMTQTMKADQVARKYGFKVCGIWQAGEPQK